MSVQKYSGEGCYADIHFLFALTFRLISYVGTTCIIFNYTKGPCIIFYVDWKKNYKNIKIIKMVL